MDNKTAYRYNDVITRLSRSYDGGASERDQREKAEWKQHERSDYLDLVLREGKTRLLEIGAGTGQDALFFQEGGLEVTVTDLSSEMIARCRSKGLDARQADFLSLEVTPGSVEALYAMNCLLHVPNTDLPDVLSALSDVLVPGGLFFLGVYGGEDPSENEFPHDKHDPPRFFSFRSDEQMRSYVSAHFEIVNFHVVENESIHFQSFTLRKPVV